ncbi:MAG: DUF3800 domain-containing protein [Armatimonadetes bacterium]|nr:DUF3800 domain-containing protein [Armatimonadota bacterium]
MASQQRYCAFLDESGQREYGPKTDRYYVVAGVIALSEYLGTYEDELAGLKRAFFGRRNVEIKSNWLRQPKECRKHYLDKYGITQPELETFVDAMYEWLVATRLTLIAGVIDKEQMQEDYSDPHHPSALGYQVFLQRYQKFLMATNALGAVMIDEPSGKSGPGNKWKDLLKRQHARLKKHGCSYTGTTFDNVLDSIDFLDSAHSSLVQLADLVAYNTFRQFKDHGSAWDDPDATQLSVYPYLDRMLPRFYRARDRVISGYGIAKMPTRARKKWVV